MEYWNEFFRLMLFWLKCVLFAGAFAMFFERRERFALRNVLYFLLGPFCTALSALLWTMAQGNVWVEFSIYGFLMQLGTVWLILCFRGRVSQYFFYYVYVKILAASGHALEGLLQSIGFRLEFGPVSAACVSLMLSFVVALFTWSINRALIRREEGVSFQIKKSYILLVLSSNIIIVILYYMAITLDISSAKILYVLILIYSISIVYFQHSTLLISQSEERRQKTQYENIVLAKLSQDAVRQYSGLKENMELLNIRCHDVKHQLRGIATRKDGTTQYFSELLDTINIYDSTVKTGNEALDVVLTDAALRCDAAGISFNSLTDGKAISFMSVADIYSLFGNAIDNAIEYLQTAEPEMRFIRLDIHRKAAFTIIRIENYFTGQLQCNGDGIPKTSKPDSVYHGFGIKSMERITAQYGGTLSIKTEDHLFQIIILLPQGETKHTDSEY